MSLKNLFYKLLFGFVGRIRLMRHLIVIINNYDLHKKVSAPKSFELYTIFRAEASDSIEI